MMMAVVMCVCVCVCVCGSYVNVPPRMLDSLSPAIVSRGQSDMVRQIRRAGKDYYKILGVPKNCDDSALKKAYRKVPPTSIRVISSPCLSGADNASRLLQLAVKLHPDKK
jgi:hypothetical protein